MSQRWEVITFKTKVNSSSNIVSFVCFSEAHEIGRHLVSHYQTHYQGKLKDNFII